MDSHDAGAELDAPPERRQLSFRASGLVIDLEIASSGGYRRLAGQLIPRQSGTVEIRAGGGLVTAAADSAGRFSADRVPLGPVSLRCRLGSDTVTGWITLLPLCPVSGSPPRPPRSSRHQSRPAPRGTGSGRPPGAVVR